MESGRHRLRVSKMGFDSPSGWSTSAWFTDSQVAVYSDRKSGVEVFAVHPDDTGSPLPRIFTIGERG